MTSTCNPSQRTAALFGEAFPFVRRAAAVQSRRTAICLGDVAVDQEDVAQELFLAVWAALRYFDRSRSSLGTFVERVVATGIVSLFRRSGAKGRRRPRDIESDDTPSYLVPFDLRIDVHIVLLALRPRDRKVARMLMDNNPAQAARALRISRPALYRSVGRIRAVLSSVGYGEN